MAKAPGHSLRRPWPEGADHYRPATSTTSGTSTKSWTAVLCSTITSLWGIEVPDQGISWQFFLALYMYEKHWKIFFLHFGVWHFVAFGIYCCPFVHFSVWDFKGTDNCLWARVFSFRAKSGNFSATSHCVMSWHGLTWHLWYYATMVPHYHGTTPRYHGTIPRFHMVLLSFWDFLGS